LHQLITCTIVLCYTGHLSHIKKIPVSNWNYFWDSSLACRIPKEFSRDLWWTLLLCNKFVLRKERERIPLVLSKGLLLKKFGTRSNYLMLTVLFSDCWKVGPRTNAAKAMQCLYTVAQLGRLVLCVMSKCGILLPIDNEILRCVS
jgi:hypothetical protein